MNSILNQVKGGLIVSCQELEDEPLCGCGIMAKMALAEGRIETPEQAKQCLEAGAYAVVVGGAITRPKQFTERFARAINSRKPKP